MGSLATHLQTASPPWLFTECFTGRGGSCQSCKARAQKLAQCHSHIILLVKTVSQSRGGGLHLTSQWGACRRICGHLYAVLNTNTKSCSSVLQRIRQRQCNYIEKRGPDSVQAWGRGAEGVQTAWGRGESGKMMWRW